MVRISAALALLIIVAFCLQAQTNSKWASARERGLKGKVHILVSSCSEMDGSYETRYKYEFARSGKLMVITSPNIKSPDCIISLPVSSKITKRNAQGEAEEFSRFFEGEILEKERYEYEYDGIGNWIKQTTFLMRNYTREGASWKEGEWQANYLCKRAIEYYP